MTWRDVFKPAKAPGLDPQDYMERLVRGVDPYWDDSDPKNKRWVFPDPADSELEKQANTRDMNLDADSKESNIETASDVYVQDYNSSVNISNVTKDDVGTDKDDAVEMGTEMADQSAPKAETQSAEPVETPAPVETPKVQQAEAATMPENSSSNEPDSVPDDYEDLPF
jgi:hypothetical protein